MYWITPHCDILTLFTTFLILEIKATYSIIIIFNSQHAIYDYSK